MKRPFAWLALPLVLMALMLCLKWHLDHPTPTRLDIETRSLFLKPFVANVNYIPCPPMENNPSAYLSPLSKQESKVFSDCLFLSPQKCQPSPISMGKKGIARFSWLFTSIGKDGIKRMTVFINPGESDNKLVIDYKNWQVEYKLHPVTAKRWLELLLANPRIGPELRARMK